MKKILFATALFLTGALFLLFALRAVTADTDLSFYWKFDEGSGTVANDSSGNNYNGTLYNNPTWLSGGGLSFNGVDQYARTDSAIPNSLGVSNQAYTLSASVRIASGVTDANIIHVSSTASGTPGWCISMLHLDSGKFRAIGWNGGPVIATATESAVPGQWYSIANTWSPDTDLLQLYVDGDLVASTPMTSYSASNSDDYIFAGIGNTGCNNDHGWFKGDIKDVRIYSTAITQEEAQDNSDQSVATPTPTPSPTPTPASAPTASPTPTNSPASAPAACTTSPPNAAPNLFQITAAPDSAVVYFSPVTPSSGYVISYGITSAADQYSVSFADSDTSGVISYAIHALAQNTTYYFKVRGQNGCMPGNWSDGKKGLTTGRETEQAGSLTKLTPTPTPRGTITVLKKTETAKVLSPTPKVTPEITPTTHQTASASAEGYDVAITVKKDGQPVAGATVELHSIPQRTVTDKNGMARFSGVAKGHHTVLFAYRGYTGQDKITLKGDKKDVAINMSIELRANTSPGVMAGIAGAFTILLIVIGILVFLLVKKRREPEENKKSGNHKL